MQKTGEGNSAWRGDQAGYHALHYRVRNKRGKASTHPCDHCGRPAHDWAQLHDTDGLDVDAHYMPLCRSCHMKYDDHIGKGTRTKRLQKGKS